MQNKYNLTELTTKSPCVPMVVSGVLTAFTAIVVYSELCFAWEDVFRHSPPFPSPPRSTVTSE